jgi:hypothetical protein
LIFTAAPYLTLVAVAACRLRPALARAAVPAVCLAWAVASGLLAVGAGDKKLPWDRFAADLVRAERPGADPVVIVTEEKYVAEPLRFYLALAGETCFQVVIEPEPAARDEDHFWVAYREPRRQGGPPPAQVFAKRGERVGDGLRACNATQTIFAVPVWRRQDSARNLGRDDHDLVPRTDLSPVEDTP